MYNYYKYRLYPSHKQKKRLVDTFKICKVIYNELLALNIDVYNFGGVSLTNFDYNRYLVGKYSTIYSQIARDVGVRLNETFKKFFRRVKDKSCKKKRFPRFKSRINSITFPQKGFKLLSDKRIKLSKIGSVPIILHRVPKGKIKTLTIKCNKFNQWFAIFSCEMPDVVVKHPSTERIGIDVGLENFATLSNGEVVANPRYLVKAERRLKLLDRRLSRKKKGSKNRAKARFRLAKQHLKVSNQRTDFLHKLSHRLTKSYSFIAVEDLKIGDMINNYHHLAKHIGDASWGIFFNMLSYKEVALGGQFIKRNPRKTSCTCSKCGTITEMPLSKKEFLCPKCGLYCHRDLNASINILNGMGGLPKTYTPVETPPLSSNRKASGIVESGTIFNES